MNDKDELIDLLCGRELGYGIHRNVFVCKLNPDWVVKVANEDGRQANLIEAKVWDEVQYMPQLKKWFAPVIAISDAGKYLIMQKAEPGRTKDYPDRLPNFLTDPKKENYGWINGQFVCIDYGGSIITEGWSVKRARKINW